MFKFWPKNDPLIQNQRIILTETWNPNPEITLLLLVWSHPTMKSGLFGPHIVKHTRSGHRCGLCLFKTLAPGGEDLLRSVCAALYFRLNWRCNLPLSRHTHGGNNCFMTGLNIVKPDNVLLSVAAGHVGKKKCVWPCGDEDVLLLTFAIGFLGALLLILLLLLLSWLCGSDAKVFFFLGRILLAWNSPAEAQTP